MAQKTDIVSLSKNLDSGGACGFIAFHDDLFLQHEAIPGFLV